MLLLVVIQKDIGGQDQDISHASRPPYEVAQLEVRQYDLEA